MRARDYSRRAVEAAVRADSKETATLWRASAGLREAEFGNPVAARQNVDEALSLSSGRDVKLLASAVRTRVRDCEDNPAASSTIVWQSCKED
jgi:hypothetical protein